MLISTLLASSVLILVILLLRRVFRGKVGNGFLYALWLVVAVRLLMPVPEFFLEKVAGIEEPWLGSSFSVMNLAAELANHWENGMAGQQEGDKKLIGEESKKASVEGSEGPILKESEKSSGDGSTNVFQANSGAEEELELQGAEETKEAELPEENNSGTAQADEADSQEPAVPENTGDSDMYEKNRGGGWQFSKFSQIPLVRIAGIVWLSGSLLLLCVQVLSERRFRRRLTECREEIAICGQKAYRARGISTPLLFRSSGFSLDIYIPEEIVEREELVAHAMLHEAAHKRHGDIWWGYLRNLLLAAYWFHPLVWVAAVCSKRDCEYACDSSVTGQMNRGERIAYGNSLLSLVELGGKGSPFHTATLMSIKKSELKKRIHLIKRGKRKGVVTTALAAVLIAAVVLATFTGAKAETDSQMEAGLLEKFSETEPQLQEDVSETGIQPQETEKESSESAQKAETEKPAEQTMRTLEVKPSELTMEKVIDRYNKKKISKWTIKDILKYKNISEVEYNEEMDKRSREFRVILPYQGIDYQMNFYFFDGKLNSVDIEIKETGESRCIYALSEDGYNDFLVPLEVFLHHDKVLDEEISYTLPEKLLETKDSYNVGKLGRLFYGEEKELYGIYGSAIEQLWNSDGGLMKSRLTCYQEEKIVDIRGNRTNPYGAIRTDFVKEFQGGRLQKVAGCENVTSLQGLVFTEDILNPGFGLTWYNQKEARKLTKKEMKEIFSNRKLWIICVMDEKNMGEMEFTGYVFFFNAEKYTKKQMIALAKSVHLK